MQKGHTMSAEVVCVGLGIKGKRSRNSEPHSSEEPVSWDLVLSGGAASQPEYSQEPRRDTRMGGVLLALRPKREH